MAIHEVIRGINRYRDVKFDPRSIRNPAIAHTPWSDEEKAIVRADWYQGIDARIIADKFGTTLPALMSLVRRMKLRPRRERSAHARTEEREGGHGR